MFVFFYSNVLKFIFLPLWILYGTNVKYPSLFCKILKFCVSKVEIFMSVIETPWNILNWYTTTFFESTTSWAHWWHERSMYPKMQEFISHNLKHIKPVFKHKMSKSNSQQLSYKKVEDTQQIRIININSIFHTIQNRSHIQRM